MRTTFKMLSLGQKRRKSELMKRGCYPSNSGLCPNFYPDEVCRGNYSDHSYSPPLLYDLTSDPSEIFTLDTDKYSDIMTQIEKVILCRIIYNDVQLHYSG